MKVEVDCCRDFRALDKRLEYLEYDDRDKKKNRFEK